MRVGVVGLGYVGLPLAACLAKTGAEVFGIDRDVRKVDAVKSGRVPLAGDEPMLHELVSSAVSSGLLTATRNPEALRDVDAVLVAVETPLRSRGHLPDYRPLRNALTAVGEHIPPESLVSVESTLAPGTMANVVQPTLERASGMVALEDFWLVHAPERLTAGRLIHNLVHLDRVLGANDSTSVGRALALYNRFVEGSIHVTDWLTAEIVKTAENAYWDMEIAFANELAILSELYGSDVYEVRRLVNTCPGRNVPLPGAGVGGPCIPKDPWLLIAGARNEGRLIRAARQVNESMPRRVVAHIKAALSDAGRPLRSARVSLLGFAYKANVGDSRGSVSITIARFLRREGATIRIHDPYATGTREFRVQRDIESVLRGSDCLAVVTPHDVYRSLDFRTLSRLMRHVVVVDGRDVIDPARLPSGSVYRGVGRGELS